MLLLRFKFISKIASSRVVTTTLPFEDDNVDVTKYLSFKKKAGAPAEDQ